jgi:hypothetical protein
LAARTEAACPATEKKQSLRAAARALDAGESVRGVPAIEEPVHYTLRSAAQGAAGVLKALLIGADEVLPVVAEAVFAEPPRVRRRVSRTWLKGAEIVNAVVSHGRYAPTCRLVCANRMSRLND